MLAGAVMATLIVIPMSRPAAREIGPGANLCEEINSLRPGEELALEPGDYAGPCQIRQGGQPRLPIVIRAADPERRPRIVYGGHTVDVFGVRASHLVIRGLEFGPTVGDVDAVRIFSGGDIAIEDCRFIQVGGIAVVANHASVRGLAVRRNVILDSRATAMYFGCQDGNHCIMSGLVVEGNYVRGVTALDPAIGYGLEVKLNSSGVIRDNVILDTKGPGIMVYGSRDLVTVSVVERNVTTGSRTSSGIVLGGGPAIVRNNVTASNAEAGIGLEDYQRRGLLRGIVVANNSVYQNRDGGIAVADTGGHEVAILNNAVHARSGVPALPPPRSGLRLAGNVNCTWAQCFANPDAMDFSPFPGSLLVGPGVIGLSVSLPKEDFFGVRRAVPPTVGAIERPSGPLRLDPPL